MELDPKHLSALYVIHERGGLTAAAAVLGTSQPALSRLVADMEIRLGVPIFDRSTRPWRMTSLGESLAAQGGAVRSAVSKANYAIEHLKEGTDGVIRLGGTPYLCEAVLPPMIARFQKIMPDVSFDQSHAYTTQLLRRLRRREIDLVIAPVDTMDITQGFASRRLLAAKNIIACREGHPLISSQPAQPHQVLNYRWIAPPADSPLAADMRNVLNTLNARDFKTAFSGGSLSSVAQIIEQSDCLAVLPAYVLETLQGRFALTSIELALSTPTRSIAMITNDDEVRSNPQSVFIDFLEENFRALGKLKSAKVSFSSKSEE